MHDSMSAAEARDRAHDAPLVSIITPTYNAAKFLLTNIASIAAQTYPPIEHIVVDGGSTDGTLDILRSRPEIRWTSGRDEGMYDAINKGLRSARGTILAYLNADDLYFPDTVRRVVECFGRHADADLVFSDCRYIDERGNELFVRKYPPYRWSLYAVMDGSTVPQQTCFWRSRLHQAAGYFDAGFRMAGDFEFLIRAGKVCSMRKIEGPPLAQFRFHQNMLTLTRRAVNDAEIERIHEMYPVASPAATRLLRAVATARFKMHNVHRVRDKLAALITGKKPLYRV
jgi:glycosyltransferase involved in cell wall biosynthesis